ncbi:YicC/YloC family endoribonuclease [Thermodesulfobacteriota bacterium]
MAQSMTGYGRSEIVSDKITGYVEVRTKNHRYSDVRISLPKELISFEIPLKKEVSKWVLRGKIDLTVYVQSYKDNKCTLSVDQNLLNEYKRLFTELRSELGGATNIDIVKLSQMSDLIKVESVKDDVTGYYPSIKDATLRALDALSVMRGEEGRELEREMNSFMDQIGIVTDKIEAKRGELIEAYHDKVREKIASVIDKNNLDEQRVYQEVAYLIEKSDVTEELTRLRSHLNQYKIIMQEDGAIGKKLDFLFQEIIREVNTIGSKASDFNIAGYVIEIKNDLEKAREQVQNIE